MMIVLFGMGGKWFEFSGRSWAATGIHRLHTMDSNMLRAFTQRQVACETATKTGMVMVFGEITTSAKVDYEAVVRKTCKEIGFTSEDVGLDADTCKVRSLGAGDCSGVTVSHQP